MLPRPRSFQRKICFFALEASRSLNSLFCGAFFHLQGNRVRQSPFHDASVWFSLLLPPFIYKDPCDYVGHISRLMSPAHNELISNLNFFCKLNATLPCNLVFLQVLRLGCGCLWKPLFCLLTIVSYHIS